jgi:TonB family protein
MKIVCDACQAKYSISDDKVQGKVFKIRCKKCSNIIVVRGGAGAQEAAPAPQEKDTRVYDYGYEGGGGGGEAAGGDDAVWHLVINQDQVGPLTVADVEAKFASGEVDAETFTWREGFADWLPLAQVDAFAAMVASGSTTTAAAGSAGADAVSSMFGTSGVGDDIGTSRSDPGDLFAAAGSSSRHSDDDGGDLFGSKPASSRAPAQAASSAQEAADKKLRGERNENSVLFSLNNLAQLASNTPAPSSSSSSSSSSSGHATGAAGGEGSGLIDIRSMASAYMGGGGGAAVGKPAAASSGIGSIDDLPVFGGGGFSEPAVIMPVASRGGRDNKMLYVMIAAVGLLAIVAIIMVVFMLKGDKKPAQVAAADTSGDKADKDKDKDKDKASEDKPKEPEKAAAGDTPKEPEKTGDAPKEPEKTGDAPKEPEKTGGTTPKAEPKHSGGTATPKEPKSGGTATPKNTGGGNTTTTPPPPPKETGGGGGCDEVSCVLNNYDGACCAKFKKGGSAPKPKTGGGGGGGDLPDGLDRSMISAGIANVKARVETCGSKSPAKGKVKVKVSVSGDGRVTNVSVETTPDPALGACVAAAVQKASFAKTQSGGSFSYPFVF